MTAILALLTSLVLPSASQADGVSALESCETDNSPPEEIARLHILPNGDPWGSDTAARLVTIAREKAKDGKDDEAIQWAMLCQFDTQEQEAISRDKAAVINYLKR